MSDKLSRFGPLLVFLAAMLWATDAPFRFYLGKELSPSFIVLAEHAVNLIFILPFLFRGWGEIRNMSYQEWLSVLLIGIGASALASILFTKSFAYVNPSVAIVLQKLQPLIAISLAVLLLKERTSKKFWLWGLLALFGAYLVSFGGLAPRLYAGETWNPNTVGVLYALGAAVLWALGTVAGRFTLRTLSFQTLTALRFITAFLFLLILNIPSGTLSTVSRLSAKDIIFILIIAVTSGFTSLMIYYKGLSMTKASVATIAELGFPLLAVIVNAAVLGVFLQGVQLVGMALLLCAVWKLNAVNRSELNVATISS